MLHPYSSIWDFYSGVKDEVHADSKTFQPLLHSVADDVTLTDLYHQRIVLFKEIFVLAIV